MSDPGPKPPAARNDGGGKEDRREPTSRGARPGYRTMPHELRAFRRPGVAASQETPEQQEAAEKLQEMGRGGDVLFDDVRERAPREPSPGDNRSEHAVMEVPRRTGGPADGDEEEATVRATASGATAAGTARPVERENAAESKRPARRKPSAALVALATVGFVVVALLVWVYRPHGGERGDGGTMSGMGTVVTGGAAGAMSVPATATSAPSAVETSLPAATSAPSASATSTASGAVAPSATAGTPAATAATSTGAGGTAPPKPTGEPQVDAGAPPPTSAPSVEPSAPPVPTAAPSVAPSSKPSAAPSHTPSTTTSRPFAPITPEKD